MITIALVILGLCLIIGLIGLGVIIYDAIRVLN
jgi:hypothetical protein